MKDSLTFGFPGGSRRSPKIGPVFGTKTEASFLVPTMDAIFGPQKGTSSWSRKMGPDFQKKWENGAQFWVPKWDQFLAPKFLIATLRKSIPVGPAMTTKWVPEFGPSGQKLTPKWVPKNGPFLGPKTGPHFLALFNF